MVAYLFSSESVERRWFESQSESGRGYHRRHSAGDDAVARTYKTESTYDRFLRARRYRDTRRDRDSRQVQYPWDGNRDAVKYELFGQSDGQYDNRERLEQQRRCVRTDRDCACARIHLADAAQHP